jgi:hypothetical protein
MNYLYQFKAAIAQSVGRLATGWTAEGSEFGQEFSFLHVVDTGSGALPASYPMGMEGSFPGGKAPEAWSCPLTAN